MEKEKKVLKNSERGVLKRFMKEFFPFAPLLKAGYFTKEMRNDYEAQAKRVCDHFGYKTVYEYGAKEVRCHITETGNVGYLQEQSERKEPFVTVIPSIYD
jgi:hypothetical protein